MKKKALLASILTIAMCFSVIAGATFALFTSESTVNVAVTSGTVDVDATILEDTLATSSLGVAQANGAFENGGNAAFDANAVLVLTNMTPGDAVTFSIEIKNNSNVNVQYRVKWAVDGKLYEALVATADGTPIVSNTSAWELWTAPATDAEKVKTVEVELTLPTEVDNEYQNQTAAIAFTVEAVQGNAIVSNVASFEQLNLALEYGNTATLVEDITLGEGESVNVPAGTTGVIDLNGKSITASGSEPAINNEGTLSIVNGGATTLSAQTATAAATISVSEVNGRAAILNSGDLTLKGVTVIGAPLGETEYPEYAIRTSGNLTIEEGTTVLSDRGCVRTDDGASVVINGGEFIVSDAANTLGRNMTLHTVYAYGATATVTINGGHFEMNHATTAGASVVCPAGAAVTINGGDFRDPLDNVDGSGDNWKNTYNIQVYMGYTAPIVVNGGTFDDYTVTHSSITIGEYYKIDYDEETGIYSVVAKDGVLFADNDAELAEVINVINTDSTYWNTPVTVVLGAAEFSGSYTLKQWPEWQGVDATNKGTAQTNVTFVGNAGTLFTGLLEVNGYGQGKSSFNDSENCATKFVNVTFDAGMPEGGDGADHLNLYVQKGADNVTFENCHFRNATHVNLGGSGTNGTGDIAFNGCDFIFGGNISGGPKTLTVTDCEFNGGYNGFINVQRGGNGNGIVTVDNTNVVCDEFGFRTNALGDITVTNSSITVNYTARDNANMGTLVYFRGDNAKASFTNCEIDCVSGAEYKLASYANTSKITIDGVELTLDSASGLLYNGKATFATYYVFGRDELLAAAEYFAGTAHSNEANIVTIELMADIDLAGIEWTPWDTMWLTFNGNGHTISNVTTKASWRAGFFGYLGAGKINDLTLENVNSFGAQAGTFMGSAEGVTTTNCTLKGDNSVTYVEYVSDAYTETWGGMGAVAGVLSSATINVEIAEGATVKLVNASFDTNCPYFDDLTGYLQENNGTVVNNGTVTK